jgi:hypothetical protein
MNRRNLLRTLAAASLTGLRARSEVFWNPSKRLLMDPELIERSEGVSLKLGTVAKDSRNPLFGEDKPWEVRFDNLYANVIFDSSEKIFKCWYNPFIHYQRAESVPRAKRPFVDYDSVPQSQPEMGVCYATSTDGLTWEKPNLGLVDYNGSTANNLVLRNQPEPSDWRPHGSGIWKDVRDPDPTRRYKIFFSNSKVGMCVSFSADGLHWRAPVRCPLIASRGDCHNNSFWAPSLNMYVGITRNFDNERRTRLVARTQSPNFIDWNKAEEVLRNLPSEPLRQTYTMIVFPYANAYLGLLMMLNRGDKIVKTDPENDTVDCELAWSSDTVHWTRIAPGNALIPRGPGRDYDSGCIYAAAYPILRNGQLWLYYGGNNGKHTDWRDGFFCLTRLRPDGFAGMETHDEGLIVTRPIGEKKGWKGMMRIAADATSGSVVVKALRGERIIAESRPVSGDLTDAVVPWRTSPLSTPSNQPLRFRFELKNSKLYSFAFG